MSKRIKNSLATILLVVVMALPGLALASQAGLVVKKQDGTTKNACVDFAGDSISGMKLLQSSGIDVTVKNGFVVSIDGEGTKENSQMSDGDPFWSYWKLDGGVWSFQNIGANYSKVKNGDVEGWEFGHGKLNLPQINFDQICQSRQTATSTQTQATNSGEGDAVGSTASTSTPMTIQKISEAKNSVPPVVAPSPAASSTSVGQVLGSSTNASTSLLPEFNLTNITILFLIFILFGILFVFIKLLFKKFLDRRRK